MSRNAFACLATVAVFLVPHRLSAQKDTSDTKSTAYLLGQYAADLGSVHDRIVAVANAIPDDKYSWRPSDGSRSVAEVLMQVVDEWYRLCPKSVGANPPADFDASIDPALNLEQNYRNKSKALEQANKAWTHCTVALSAADTSRLVPQFLAAHMPFPRAALLISGGQHEHLEQLIIYARLTGAALPCGLDRLCPPRAPIFE